MTRAVPAGDHPRRLVLIGATITAAGAIVAVEALLVAPGHLLTAQICDALLVLVLVNAGPRREAGKLPDATNAAIAALRALALVPLMRVVALGLPMRDWSEPVAIMAVALPVGAVALRLAALVGLRLGDLLAPRAARFELYALVAGVALGLLAYLAGAPALWPDHADDGRIALGLAAAVVAASVEELVFRGLVQGTLHRALGRGGVLAAAAVFAATYLDAGSAPLVLTVALAGLIFGHVVARTGTLAGAVLGHVLLVVGAGAVWPALLDSSDSLSDDTTVTVALSIAIAAVAVLACRPPAGRPAGLGRLSARRRR